MKMKNRYITLALCILITVFGCGKKETETEVVTTLNEETESVEKEPYFPAAYRDETEKVMINCSLEVPEGFDPYHFHLPKVTGIQYYNTEKAYAKFVEGKEIAEQHDSASSTEGVPGMTYYVMPNDDIVGIGSYLNYALSESSVYRTVVRSNERFAPKEDFSFGSGDGCTEEVIDLLREIEYPVDEFYFDWFSTSGSEYEILEQRALEDGMIENQKADGWTEENNAYEIYGWQMYEGLSVFPQIMTSLMSRAIVNYQRAPVAALYNKNGMLTLMANEPYLFEHSEDIALFKPFPEIADVLIAKYDNLLNELTYSVTRAKLAVRVFYDESQMYQAEPVWYFEVYDNHSNLEIALFNAVTAEEIYLP